MIAVFLVNSLIVMVAVIIHYEFLYRLTLLLPRIQVRHRFRIVLGVGGALLAHAAEVWILAFAYYLMHRAGGWGCWGLGAVVKPLPGQLHAYSPAPTGLKPALGRPPPR